MKLILHIGQQKTGSTSLQRFLFDNYGELQTQGILYPRSLGIDHFKQHYIFKHRDNLFDEALKLKEALTLEIEQSKAKTVIISDENLFFGKRINKQYIVTFLKTIFDEIEVLVYLRRQDLHIPSHYQQSQLGLVTLTFDAWIDKAFNAGYYDYYSVVKSWKDALPQAKFTIKPMSNLLRKDARFDIANTLGLDLGKFIFLKSQQLNESVDWKIIPLLRSFNQLISEEKNDESKKTLKEIKSKFLEYALSISKKNKLSLNRKQHQKVSEYYSVVNKKLVLEFNINEKDASYFLKVNSDKVFSNFPLESPTISDLNILNDFVRSSFKSLDFEERFLKILSNIRQFRLRKDETDEYNNDELKAYTKAIAQLYKENSERMKNEINIYKPTNISDKKLYFLHIAKCGGTSVRDYLDQLFTQTDFVAGLNPEMLSQYSQEEIKRWKLISGHLDRTVLNYIEPDLTMTWLREPVDRLISTYGRLKQLTIENRDDFKKNEITEKLVTKFENDDDYFTLDNSEFIRNSNLMTKSLGSNFLSYERYIGTGESKLQEAKRFLTNNIHFFGILTRHQESMDLLSYTLGQIPQSNYLHSNETNAKYKESYKSENHKEFFTKISDLDSQLWQYGVDLFNERFNQTLHSLWSKYNGYNEQINNQTNFNNIEYSDIRSRLLDYMTKDIQQLKQEPLQSSLEYTFDKPLKGEGWSQREWFNDMTHYTLRWINKPIASIYLPLDRANILECYIHIPHQVTDLKNIYVDGESVYNIRYLNDNSHSKDNPNGKMVHFTIPISLDIDKTYTKIEIEVSSITSPNQIDNTNTDRQLKSIAVDWIRILPLSR